MFTLFLFVLIIYGIDSLLYIFSITKTYLNKYYGYLLTAMFAIPNHFYIFKDKKFLVYSNEKLPTLRIIIIVLSIFVCSIMLVIQTGPKI